MPEVNKTVAAGLAAYYQYIAQDLHKWADPLSNEQFWRQPYPYGNSVGHLLLHLTGNLNYYIGARIAETGYVRDRDREFTEKQPHRRKKRCGPLIAPSRWWMPRFENRRRRTGEKRTLPSANLRLLTASRFSCVVRGMRIIM